MAARDARAGARGAPSFDDACSRLEAALSGPARSEILAETARSTVFGDALVALRHLLRAHVLKAAGHHISLAATVAECDRRGREDGFHVLHDWDGKAERHNDDIIPVDVLNYLIDQRGDEPPDTSSLAILLDYYLMYVLALLSLRVWDEGDADRNLDRLNQLLGELQGPNGSGQPFVADAATLLLIATSHYELDERGFAPLLDRVRSLGRRHRTAVALSHAAAMGSHLRFGFEATYGRDTVTMRDDNVVDYPWLCLSLATLIQEYARMRDEGIEGPERDRIVEGLLNGLCADARAFIGQALPSSLSRSEPERAEFAALFHRHSRDLAEAFEPHRPSDQTYSPIAFFFNFSHNILKGTIVDAVLRGEPWHLTVNDLLTGIPRGGPESASKTRLATTLMAYARANPDRIRGQLKPVVVYDPWAGRQAFAVALRKLRE